ncbi:MAG: MFS transporter [Candidatus Edwardsbacteria bacterium]|nr:MFS transporter [Pseudomonadota bacterium]MBU2464661.1 MFS transporter [Candidatus Edwardsbacteria bacterium]
MQYKSLLKNRDYRLFWVSQSLSAAGSTLSSMGLLWYASVNVGSLTLAGLIGTAWGLPSILGLLAGTVADRVDRRQLMLKIDGFSAALMLVLASIIYFEQTNPYLILIFVFGLSLLREFFESASFAFLPSLVNKSEVASANAFLNTSQQGTLTLARAIGGGLLSSIGVVGLLVVDAISYLASTFSLLAIRMPSKLANIHAKRSESQESISTLNPKTDDEAKPALALLREIWVDLKTGFSQMWSNPLISKVVPWALPANAAYGAVLVLLPGWVNQVLGKDASIYGLVISSGTVGFILGSILAPLLVRRYQANWIMGGFTLLEAVALLFFTLSTEPSLAIMWYTLVGFFDGMSSPVFFSLLQVEIPEEYLGRIFGGLMTLLAFGQPIGMFLGGLLAESNSLFFVFTASAILIGLAGLYFIWAKPLRVRLPSEKTTNDD